MTFQDYEKASTTEENKRVFLLKAVEWYKTTDKYKKAVSAQNYYARKNEEVLKRLSFLERANNIKLPLKFFKICNGFFPKAVKRLVMYLLGNGATLESAVKSKVDKKFDRKIVEMGLNACVDGVCWGFPDMGKLVAFRATEFFTLVDECNGENKVGIRFYQVDAEKPLNIELYEINGLTKYTMFGDKTSGKLEITTPQKSYKTERYTDEYTDKVIGGANYGYLPVFPMYANELHTSELDDGLKGFIDAWDFVASDLTDDILQNEGIYTVVKNFGGEDLAQLLSELKFKKASSTDGITTGVDVTSVEIPFQAKQFALDNFERKMYADWLLPDNQLSGRDVTAFEIKTGTEEFDIKADLFEYQAADFIENILRVYGIDMILPDFKRRTKTNDTEITNNISTMMSDGYIDNEEAIELNPLLPQGRKAKLLKRVNIQALKEANSIYPLEDEEDDSEG